MKTAQTIEQVRALVKNARSQSKTIGFVPTMGALHLGHISLIKAAKAKTDFVVVSIFVNPAQFGPNEDFSKYPRPIEEDLKSCEQNDVDLVFNPTPEQMYAKENLTWVNVEKLTDTLCGRSRPGHFRGVTTVCTKLFNIVMPDFVFFGQKDAQQAIVIKRMVADLNMPLEIVICPTIRESDGLAMSSRNKYLSLSERKDAPLLYESLQKAAEIIKKGVTNKQKVVENIEKVIKKSSKFVPEYIEIVDAQTLESQNIIKGQVLIAVAARIGQTRLIDNIIIDAPAE